MPYKRTALLSPLLAHQVTVGYQPQKQPFLDSVPAEGCTCFAALVGTFSACLHLCPAQPPMQNDHSWTLRKKTVTPLL